MIGISIKMFLVVTLPVIIGMVIRKFAATFISSNEKLIQSFTFIICYCFLAIWVEEWENITTYLKQAGL